MNIDQNTLFYNCNKFDEFHAWVDLNINNNHTSINSLSNKWGWSRTKTKAYIAYLKKEQLINIEKINNNIKIQIISKKEVQLIKNKKPIIIYDFTSHNWVNINEEKKALWNKSYPAVNIEIELNKMASWLEANPKNRKSNYERFIINWLKRAQDSYKNNNKTLNLFEKNKLAFEESRRQLIAEGVIK